MGHESKKKKDESFTTEMHILTTACHVHSWPCLGLTTGLSRHLCLMLRVFIRYWGFMCSIHEQRDSIVEFLAILGDGCMSVLLLLQLFTKDMVEVGCMVLVTL